MKVSPSAVVVTSTAVASLALLGTVAGARAWTRAASRNRVTDAAGAPHAPWAVVLGAAVTPEGLPENALRYRLDLGAELALAGRCERVLVSGGVRHGENEPEVMARYLQDRGVDPAIITRDPLGDNTFNSAQRASHVYGIRRALVVTQEFHVHRAVALFRAAGVDAYGVADQRGRLDHHTWRYGVIRELASNVKALADVVLGRRYLTHASQEDPR